MLTQNIKSRIIEALEMKMASIKRAQNTNKSPNFAAVYDIERKETQAAITWAQELAPETPPKTK